MATESGQDIPKVGNWAIVYSGPRIFIGNLVEDNPSDDWKDMSPAYEITSQLIPTGRHPNGQIIMSKNISAEPILLSFNESRICVRADAIISFLDVHESDRARYKKLVESAQHTALQARAADAGLETPKGGGLS